MKYTVTGRVPIATKKGDVEPGGTIDAEDIPPYVSVRALIAAGHLQEAEAKKASGEKTGTAK